MNVTMPSIVAVSASARRDTSSCRLFCPRASSTSAQVQRLTIVSWPTPWCGAPDSSARLASSAFRETLSMSIGLRTKPSTQAASAGRWLCSFSQRLPKSAVISVAASGRAGIRMLRGAGSDMAAVDYLLLVRLGLHARRGERGPLVPLLRRRLGQLLIDVRRLIALAELLPVGDIEAPLALEE